MSCITINWTTESRFTITFTKYVNISECNKQNVCSKRVSKCDKAIQNVIYFFIDKKKIINKLKWAQFLSYDYSLKILMKKHKWKENFIVLCHIIKNLEIKDAFKNTLNEKAKKEKQQSMMRYKLAT